MFQATTVLPLTKETFDKIPNIDLKALEAHKLAKKEEEEKKSVEEMKAAEEAKASGKQPKKMKKKKDEEEKYDPRHQEEIKTEIPWESRNVDYRKDFFGKPAFLTVSG